MSTTEPLRLGMVGGGPGAMIGPTHRIAAHMYGDWRLVAGAFSRRPERNRAMGAELGLDPGRVYADYREMARAESAREDGIEAVAVVTPNDSHVPDQRVLSAAGHPRHLRQAAGRTRPPTPRRCATRCGNPAACSP